MGCGWIIFTFLPAWQGRRVGRVVLPAILAAADARGLAVRLGALKESASTGFISSMGLFWKTRGSGIATMCGCRSVRGASG